MFKRVFKFDRKHCPTAVGSLEVTAARLGSAAIERILTHLGLQTRALPLAPARELTQHAA